MSGSTRGREFDYQLGVDLGTTYASTAILRGFRAEMVVLGHRSALLPSAVWLGPGGEVLVGEPALRRGHGEPEGLVREFKRRLGDQVPFVVRGAPVSAAQLTTILLASIIEQVIAREGSPPAGVAVTHPANWGPYRRDLFREAARSAGVPEPILITEPEAAALYYASAGRVADGEIVVVYDLGGGTFDVAILQRHGDQFAFVGRPDGVDRLGGIDFDEIVFDYVRAAAGGLEATGGDGAWKAAMRRLHDDCVDAKEALSADVAVEIPVMIPARHTSIRLPRREFEALIRPSVAQTIDAVRRALASAQLEPEDIARVLLVGGSSRIPLVAEQISSNLHWSVSVDAHPKFAVVLGAAMAAASGGAIDERVAIGAPSLEPLRGDRLPAPEAGGDGPARTAAAVPATRSRRGAAAVVGAGIAAVTLAAAVLLAVRNSDSPPSRGAGTTNVPLSGSPVGLAAGFGSAWVAGQDGRLVQLDADTRRVRGQTALAPSLDDVLVGGSDIWVTSLDVLYRVDPASLSVKQTIEMPGRPDGIARSRGTVWIALVTPSGGSLYRVDEGTGERSVVATFPRGVTEVAPDDGTLWVSSVGSVVYRVDASSGTYSEIDLGGTTQGILIAFGDLWATLPVTNEVVRVDRTSARPIVRIPTGPAPNEIVLGDGVIWVSEEGGASVGAIDPASNEIARRLSVGAGPDRLVWHDPDLWVANAGENSLSIVRP